MAKWVCCLLFLRGVSTFLVMMQHFLSVVYPI